MKKKYDDCRKKNSEMSTHDPIDALLHEAFREDAPELQEELIQRTLQAVRDGKKAVYGDIPEKIQREKPQSEKPQGEKLQGEKLQSEKLQNIKPQRAKSTKATFLCAVACLLFVVCGGVFLRHTTGGFQSMNGVSGEPENSQKLLEQLSGEAKENQTAAPSREDMVDGALPPPSSSWQDYAENSLAGGSVSDGCQAEGGMKNEEGHTLYAALPLLSGYVPEELQGSLCYRLLIDGEVCGADWEEAAVFALEEAAPRQTAPQAGGSAEERSEKTVTLVAETEGIYYAFTVGTYCTLTIRTKNGEECFFFEISDLTPYEELFSMEL